MTTLEQRELAGVSDISKPTLPTESKHASDEAYREANAIAIFQRDLRKLDGNEMKLYDDNKKIQLAETFDTKKAVANEIKEQIKHWGLKYIEDQSAPKAA